MKDAKELDVVCYYHNDMDGIASASIVKTIYPNAKFIKCDYGNVWKKEDIEDKVCIIVDFSFANMDEINKHCRLLCWIDHHESAKERNKRLWESDNIDGFRDTNKAACELTWNWFYPYEEVPMAIKYIADRDLWKFEFGEKTKAFHEYASMHFKKPSELLVACRKTGQLLIHEGISHGNILLLKKKEQIRKSFEQGQDIMCFGVRTRIINTNVNVSDTGEYCYKDKNYPLALIWSVRNNIVVCSLRSNTIDVREIAESFDGGGHKFAAGFKLSLKDFARHFGNE